MGVSDKFDDMKDQAINATGGKDKINKGVDRAA